MHTEQKSTRVGQAQMLLGPAVCRMRTAHHKQGVHALRGSCEELLELDLMCLMTHPQLTLDKAKVSKTVVPDLRDDNRRTVQLLMQGEDCHSSPCG